MVERRRARKERQAAELAQSKGKKGNGRFARYAPEGEKQTRQAEVVEDETLKQLKDAYRRSVCEYYYETMEVFDEPYEDSLKNLEGINYTAEDVEKFTIALAEFQDEKDFSKKAGLFLSALINNGNDTDYTVITNHLSEPLHCFAYKNRKNIVVEGNVGESFAHYMEAGTVLIQGDAGDHLANRMIDGEITVEGNVGFGAASIQGGKVTIKGNAGHSFGSMQGGEIHIEGEYGSISAHYIRSGKIYHRGKLIVDK